MDMQLAMIWLHSNAMAGKSQRDAFADPLDSPEWDGLIRVLMLARSIARGMKSLPAFFRSWRKVNRPVEAASNCGVCVS